MRTALAYRLLVLGFALCAATRPLPAQVVSSGASAGETQRRTYGTADTIIQQIPSAAFQLRSGAQIQEFNYGYIYDLAGVGIFVAPLNLPNGALVNFLDLYFYDTDAIADPYAHDVYATLFEVTGMSPPSESLFAQVFSGGSGGYGYSFQLISPPLQINNMNRYFIYVYNAKGPDKSFGAVNVWYRLQMSPAPATATFGDVPTSHPYFRAIEALASSGITGGCGGGNFCPSQNVTRGEMAAFLARALGLHWPY
ncbi:MAG: S-layer homology domain-containing protein [Acidobacteriota bacterium]